MITHENTLSERERYVLTALASNADATASRRAQALLGWSRGESREKIAQTTGLRPAQVQYLTRAFSQKRLELFSPSSIELAGRGQAGSVEVEGLLQKHHTDLAHARYVAALAAQIFAQTSSVHQLEPGSQRLLETGALLHNIGAAGHDDRHHRAGRDILLAHELVGFSPRDRDMLACLALFQRRRVQASRDPIFAALPQETQHVTLALAAILRIADGLDYSQTQSTVITSIKVNALVDVVIEGPHAETDVARASKKADLWREVLSPPLFVRLANQTLPAQTLPKRPKIKTDVRSHEPITRAGRKIIGAQFAKVQSLEDAVRAGDNIEAVHDMRVATRRIRSAFRLLRTYYPNKTVRRLSAPLRELADDLGQVRDLDVLIENLRTYTATLTIEQQRTLDPLLADWQARRAQAHRELVDFLDGANYDQWVARTEDFIEVKESSDSPRVADVVPALIWKHYGKLRDHERRVKQPTMPLLHALRIRDKRLRYALEFFAGPMGDQSALLLEPLIALQDYLGALHDADMATQLIAEFIAAQARFAQRHGMTGTDFQGVAGYLGALRTRIGELQAGFPERWQIVIKPGFRHTLALAVAAL
jgi:CHAD domain-containing protein